MREKPTSPSLLATRRVLVTGAAGFIGSHLCERLRDGGAEIHAVSGMERSPQVGGISWQRSAFDSLDEVRRILAEVRPDVVYHLGGHVTAAPDITHVLPAFSSLLASTVYLLLGAAELDGCRVVLAGSFTEPGNGGTAPQSPYAAAKLGVRAYARMFRELYQTPVVLIRPFMVYGPRQKESKVIPYIVTSLLRGCVPRLGNGTFAADWVYIDDVIDAFIKAATAPAAVGAEIDLGTGMLTTLREVAAKIVALLGTAVCPQFGVVPDRPGETFAAADVEHCWSILEWRAETTLSEGLERTVAWHRQRLALSGELAAP